MPSRTIKISALNVTAHPHEKMTYVELFRDAFALSRPVKLRGNQAAMVGTMRFLDENDRRAGIYGEIHRFIDFSLDGPWFNLIERQPAKEVDLATLQMLENLKPGYVFYRYVFFPKKHKLFFEVYDDGNNISPKSVEELFTTFFNQESLRKKYGPVKVFIEPSKEDLKQMLSIANIKRVELRINKPNPDHVFGLDKIFEDNMDNWSAGTVETKIVAENGESITPDDNLEKLAQLAASNGYVEVSGTNADGRRVKTSTRSHPLIEAVNYDPKIEEPSAVFLNKALDMLRNLFI